MSLIVKAEIITNQIQGASDFFAAAAKKAGVNPVDATIAAMNVATAATKSDFADKHTELEDFDE